MDNSEITENSANNSLNELKSFLDKQFTPVPEVIRPEIMEWEDMELFFKTKIIPVYNKLEKQLSEYKFDKVSFTVHRRVATLRIHETLRLFHFKVDIDNSTRQIVMMYDVSYRPAKKKKLIQTYNNDRIKISFFDIDTINEDLIISLFTKWYINKEEVIQQDIEQKKAESIKIADNTNQYKSLPG